MAGREKFDTIIRGKGYDDYRWISPAEIVVSQWVRMKCRYGCGDYGRNHSCPPNTPSIAECREFFRDYSSGVILHFAKRFDDPKDRHIWSAWINRDLLELERELFLSGCHKAFVLFMDTCHLCGTCDPTACRNRPQARPAPEALGVDVFATVRQVGYPIEVLQGLEEEMNRYAFLLVE